MTIEVTNEDIVNQEISKYLNEADELIQDSVLLPETPEKNEVITDSQILKNIPIPKKEERKWENINELLDSLDSKHEKLVNHFSPYKEVSHEENENLDNADSEVIVKDVNY